MTYDQLEAVDMIVKKGSFKAAAKALRRTQPTLSVAVKKLEAEFELTIFSREEYRPKLTEAGQVFHKWAQQALQSFRKLEVVGKELGIAKAEPRLTVVVDPVAGFEAMKAIFSECLDDLKATELTLRSEIISVGTDLVRRGEADFAITPRIDAQKDLESFSIEVVPMIPVIAAARTAGGVEITEAWLRTQPQIIAASMEDLLAPDKRDDLGLLDGGARCFVTDHSLKRRLIEQGFGWGRLAKHEIEAGISAKTLVQVPEHVTSGFLLDLHVMRSKLRPMGPVAQAIWKKLGTLKSGQKTIQKNNRVD